MRHQSAFSGNHRKEVFRERLCQSCIPLSHCFQRIKKTLAVQLILCHFSIRIFCPQFHITPLIEFIKVLERPEIAVIFIFAIHFFKGIAGIIRKSPKSIIEIEKKILVLHKKEMAGLITLPSYDIIKLFHLDNQIFRYAPEIFRIRNLQN